MTTRRWLLVGTLAFIVAYWLIARHFSNSFWRVDDAAVLPPLERLDDGGAWDELLAIHASKPDGCDKDRLKDAVAAGGPDPDALAPCRDVLVALDRWMASHERITVPPSRLDFPDPDVDDLIMGMMTLGDAWILRAREGEDGRDLVAVMDLGARLQRGGSSVLAVAFGEAIEDRALQELEDRIASAPLELFEPARPFLVRRMDEPGSLSIGLLGECHALGSLLHDVPALAGPTGLPDWVVGPALRPLYSERKTRALHAAHCLDLLAWAARKPSARGPEPELPDLAMRSPVTLLDNGIGRLLITIAEIPAGDLAQRGDELAVRRALLVGALAIRRAEELGEIDPVPSDPWDGEPLEWDEATRTLKTRLVDDQGARMKGVTLGPPRSLSESPPPSTPTAAPGGSDQAPAPTAPSPARPGSSGR